MTTVTRNDELDVFAGIRSWASPQLIDFLDQLILIFPEKLKFRLKQVIDGLPPEGDNLQRVLELVRSQWKDIKSERAVKIAVVGTSQTGKVSLVEAILRKQGPQAESLFYVVDTQILEEFLGFGNRSTFENEIRDADLILLVLDGRYELSASTLQMYEILKSLGKEMLVLLNKIDLVPRARPAIKAARRLLGTTVIPVSVYIPETLDRLLEAIVATNPKTLNPLTRNFPEFRRSICNGIVAQSSLASGVVGAIPLPVSDLLPITAIQTAMILKIAHAFGFPLNQARVRELLPALAAGAAVRQGAHHLRRRFPAQGKLIAVSVAGLWSYALGQAAILYFEQVSRFVQKGETVPFPAAAPASP